MCIFDMMYHPKKYYCHTCGIDCSDDIDEYDTYQMCQECLNKAFENVETMELFLKDINEYDIFVKGFFEDDEDYANRSIDALKECIKDFRETSDYIQYLKDWALDDKHEYIKFYKENM